jgi:hypothetical protein
MNQSRTAANWHAICAGRDLLKEVDDLIRESRNIFEKEFRKQISEEILNPREFRFKTGCAGDSLD